jgi:hypothetical protein
MVKRFEYMKGGQAKKGEERRKQSQRTDEGRTIGACKKGYIEKEKMYSRDDNWKDSFLFTESIG